MKDVRDELVRIDSEGQAHPIGTLASQRLRKRAGTYRLLPGPKHVVFMRYTGEDGQRDDEDGAIVRLSGELTAPGAMCDVLALLAQSGWRGELVVSDSVEGHERSMFFDQGNVVGVATTAKQERLGAVIYHFGGLSEEALRAIETRVSGGRRFGEVAVELGHLEPEEVYQYIGKQVREVVFASLMVHDGTFYFLHDFDDARVSSRYTTSATSLLMDGVTRLDELKYFRQKIPSHLHVPKRLQGPPPPEELLRVYDCIDGERTIEEIGRFTGLGEFETTRQIYTLIQSKHVEVRPPPPTGGPKALVTRANNALGLIHDMLAQAGRLPELSQALASFAAGAGMYDILFRQAGPDERGQFDPEKMTENALLVSGGAAPEVTLGQLLSEYTSFALFSAGALLGPDVEQQLRARVQELWAPADG